MRSNNVTKKSFFVTSAPFACGIGWLVNVLLKLEIKGTSLKYKETNWRATSQSNYWEIGEQCRPHLLNHLPVLGQHDKFKFRDDLEFFWEHRLSYPADEICPAIVVIRDPRDAIFSLYRRWAANGWIKVSYLDFLNAPSEWPDHFPGLYHLNPIKTYLLFNLMWLKSSQFRPILFVRFEEFKTEPLKVIEQVFKFLHLKRPCEESMEAAVQSSSIENAKKVMHNSSEPQMGAIHKGIVNEWTQTYEAAWLACFAEPEVGQGLDALGYPTVIPRRDDRLARLTSAHSQGLKDRVVNTFMDKRSFSKSAELMEKLSQRADRFHVNLGQAFERRILASHWAANWAAGGAGAGEREMRSYLYHAMQLLLRPHEIDYALAKSKELSNSWDQQLIHQQKQRFAQLNAL